MYWRTDIAEVPLVGRDLTRGMQKELLQHQVELFFGEIRIDRGKGDGVKREVPRCIPRIFPLVGHRDDVLIHHVEPFAVPHETSARLYRIYTVLLEPLVHVEKEVLFAP